MSALFHTPKMPAVQTPPPQPVVDQTMVDRQMADITRRRRGRAATDLTGSAPAGGTGTAGAVGTAPLLGS